MSTCVQLGVLDGRSDIAIFGFCPCECPLCAEDPSFHPLYNRLWGSVEGRELRWTVYRAMDQGSASPPQDISNDTQGEERLL